MEQKARCQELALMMEYAKQMSSDTSKPLSDP